MLRYRDALLNSDNPYFEQMVRLKIKCCLFVLYLPTHTLPPTQKIILHFHEEKIFYCLQHRSFVYKDSGLCQRLGLDTTVRQHF